MEVILLEKVRNLGSLGEKVKVKAGYGRNFLIPTGRAVMATAENLAAFEARRAELEKRAAEEQSEARSRAQKLADLGEVTMKANAGEEGKLFGSIGPGDVAEALTAAGVEIAKREVLMPEGPIRTLGDYELEVQFHTDVVQAVTVKVEAE